MEGMTRRRIKRKIKPFLAGAFVSTICFTALINAGVIAGDTEYVYLTKEEMDKHILEEVEQRQGMAIPDPCQEEEIAEEPEQDTEHVSCSEAVVSRGEIRQRISLGNFSCTAYCLYKEDGSTWSNGITSTGTTAQVGRTIAVDPNVIPYGTTVYIDGHAYIAEDCGSEIKGNDIDIFVSSYSEAINFGRQTKEVFVER